MIVLKAIFKPLPFTVKMWDKSVHSFNSCRNLCTSHTNKKIPSLFVFDVEKNHMRYFYFLNQNTLSCSIFAFKFTKAKQRPKTVQKGGLWAKWHAFLSLAKYSKLWHTLFYFFPSLQPKKNLEPRVARPCTKHWEEIQAMKFRRLHTKVSNKDESLTSLFATLKNVYRHVICINTLRVQACAKKKDLA